MKSNHWSLVETASQLLEQEEREAVVGDLVEAGEGAWHGLLDVLGLVLRRQAGLWTSWRPWLAAFGVALPGSFLLMGFSVSVSWAYLHFDRTLFQVSGLALGPGPLPLICHALLLIGCAWTCGFVVGSVSRRTLWVSIAATFAPCMFCFSRFGIESLSRFCLLLFLVPAFSGVHKGMRETSIGRTSSLVLAMALTALMLCTSSGNRAWLLNCALVWPVWYMVATAQSEINPRTNDR